MSLSDAEEGLPHTVCVMPFALCSKNAEINMMKGNITLFLTRKYFLFVELFLWLKTKNFHGLFIGKKLKIEIMFVSLSVTWQKLDFIVLDLFLVASNKSKMLPIYYILHICFTYFKARPHGSIGRAGVVPQG